MAKDKRKGKGKKRAAKLDPRIKKLKQEIGLLWQLAAIIAATGGLLQIIGVSLTSWIEVDGYTLHYQSGLLQGNDPTTITYSASKFGLYLTYFNAFSVPWYQRVSSVCGGYALLAEQVAVDSVISLWDSSCGMNCVGHYKTRCSAYKQLATLGYVACAGLIGGACLDIVGAAWLFIFGKSKQFLQFAWISAGLVGAAAAGYWVFSASTSWTQLGTLSAWPKYKFGAAPWLAFFGCFLSLLAGVIILCAAALDAHREWKIKKEKIVAEEVGEIQLPTGMQPVGILPPPQAVGPLGGLGRGVPPPTRPSMMGSGGYMGMLGTGRGYPVYPARP